MMWGNGLNSFFMNITSITDEKGSFPHWIAMASLIEQLIGNKEVYFWTFSSVSFICLSVLTRVPHCLGYFSFIVKFEIGKC